MPRSRRAAFALRETQSSAPMRNSRLLSAEARVSADHIRAREPVLYLAAAESPGDELREECLDALVEFVADQTHLVHRPPGGVVELPVPVVAGFETAGYGAFAGLLVRVRQ